MLNLGEGCEKALCMAQGYFQPKFVELACKLMENVASSAGLLLAQELWHLLCHPHRVGEAIQHNQVDTISVEEWPWHGEDPHAWFLC